MLVLFHVVSGTIAVIAGLSAIFAPKGRAFHVFAGRAFLASMLASAGAGAVMAAFKPEAVTMLAGHFTAYLVLTAWRTAVLREKRSGWPEIAALAGSATILVFGALFTMEALNAPDGLKDGYAADSYLFFTVLGGVAALGDASIIFRRGIIGPQRLARHLWRMSFALFIAVGSLFTGPGATAFPEGLRGSPLLSAPELIVLLLLVFWLARVLLTKWAREPAGRIAPAPAER